MMVMVSMFVAGNRMMTIFAASAAAAAASAPSFSLSAFFCFVAVQVLLEHGADPNAVDSTSRTPLHRAARWGSPDCSVLLLDAGADIEARDRPLHAHNPNPRNPICARQYA